MPDIRVSRFSVFRPLDDGRVLLLNTLSGAVDMIDAALAGRLHAPGGLSRIERSYFTKRGHLWASKYDESSVVEKLRDHLLDEARRASPLKFVLIPTYRCNINCTYCWQQPFIKSLRRIVFDSEKLDAMFQAMERLADEHAERSEGVVVQLFGGEPLMARNMELVSRILDRSAEHDWRVTVTTNGMGVEEYQSVFRTYPPAELQVTVDGGPELQRMRRRGSDFETIARGIDQLLFQGDTFVKLRVNLDRESLSGLVELANLLIDRKWFTNPMFMAYLTPTRDPGFGDDAKYDARTRLLDEYLAIRQQAPQVEILRVIAWTGFSEMQRLAETGRLPSPAFHSCEANLNMFVLDPQGLVFACNETNGQGECRVGRFWPQFEIDETALASWRRPIYELRSTCQSCPWLPYCGGGCALAASGSAYFRAYCRAVRSTFNYSMGRYARRGGGL